MKTANHRALYWKLLLALFVPGLALAQENGLMVIAEEGAVMKVTAGLYGELFPSGVEANADSSVLALDLFNSEGNQRYLVPATEDYYSETPEVLHYEKASHLTYLLWEGLQSGLHPVLYLTSFDGYQWSEPLQIRASIFADKTNASFVVVPDSPNLAASTEAASMERRTVIYVVWSEETGNAGDDYVVPIILQGGEYIGWHRTVSISDLLAKAGPMLGIAPFNPPDSDPNLGNLLRMQASSRSNAVVVGMVDSRSGQLVTLELEMLPVELDAFAERVKQSIAELGATSESVDELVARVRASMMEGGSDFHRGMLSYLADQIESLLREHSTVAAAVAPAAIDKAGIHIIAVGARARSKGLVDREPLEILTFGQAPSGGEPYHHLKVSIIGHWLIPQVDGEATLFLSRTGNEALVAWNDGDNVVYRETEGVSWSDPQWIEFREGLDQQTAYSILANRTLNR